MDRSLSSPQGQPQTHQQKTETATTSSTNCHLCNRSYGHADTIKCFKCSTNFHSVCVNVSNDEQNPTWTCPNCSTHRPRAAGSVASLRSGSSLSSRSRHHELELQRLQEETQLEREFIKKKYEILERANNDRDDAQTINSSVHQNPVQQPSVTQEQINVETKNHGPRPIPDETSFYALPLPTTTITTPIMSNQQTACSQHVSNNNIILTTAAQPVYTTASFNKNINSFINNNKSTNNLHSTSENLPPLPPFDSTAQISHPMQPAPPFNFSQIDPSLSLHPSFTFRPSTSNNRRLTQQQINARQSVPKELPIFTGKPEEWPLFSSTYDWSTSVCGLTDAENLVRLQKALRGDALKSVQHILIHPYGVSCAISTLKLLYGQPERILNSLKNKIKSMPNVTTNKLNTITTFAVEIKGLETTIKACGLIDV